MKKILLIITVILLITVTCLSFWIKNERTERKRFEQNQTSLLSSVEYYKTEAGNSAASVQRLELSKSEIEKHCEDLTRTISDLNIKVKRMQSASSTTTKTEVKIETIIKDSVVIRDNIVDTLQCIEYADPWLSVDGCIDKDSFSGAITNVDTIVQIVHRIPKKFWFIRYGTKAIRQEVVSKNPHTQIVYTEYIELKKK